MTPMEEARITCRYAMNLGHTALHEHFDMWLDAEYNASVTLTGDEPEYIEALAEIKSKLGTDKCLLK